MAEQRTSADTLKPAQLSQLFTSLAMMYSSGLPLAEGFNILTEAAADQPSKLLLGRLAELTTGGARLSEAFAEVGGLPQYAQSMLVVAEQTGRLSETCESLAGFYDRRDHLTAAIRSSLVYPLAMMLMIFIVVVMLITQALPIFDQVFAQLGFGMSGLAASLMSLGVWLRQTALVLSSGIIALILMIFLFRFLPIGRRFYSWLYEHNPLTSKLSVRLSVQRLMMVMAAMLKSGMTPLAAMDTAMEVVTDSRVRQRLAEMRQKLESGESFQKVISDSGLLPQESQAMVALSFRSGLNAEAFEIIGENISYSTERQMVSLVAAIEPSLIAVMCVLVGIILLAVMLPLLGFLTSI